MDDAANITKEIMNMGHLKSDGHEITQTAFIISLPFLVPLIIYGIRLFHTPPIRINLLQSTTKINYLISVFQPNQAFWAFKCLRN